TTRYGRACAAARGRERVRSPGIVRPTRRSPSIAKSRDNSRTIQVSAYGPPYLTSTSHPKAAQRALAAGAPPAGGHRDHLLGRAFLRPGTRQLGRERYLLPEQSQARDALRRQGRRDARLDDRAQVPARAFLCRVLGSAWVRERPADRRAEGAVRPERAEYPRGVRDPRPAGEGGWHRRRTRGGRSPLSGRFRPVPQPPHPDHV